MPEGPEIRHAADELATAIGGKQIARVFFAFTELKPYASKIEGARISAIRSRGKAILTQLDNGVTIYTHNQLYGRWQVLPAGPYPESTRQLRLAIHTDENMALLYSASTIELLNQQQLQEHPYLKKLGPELLDPATTIESLKERFRERRFQRRCLMGLLQEQGFISGMGNYLCCETLHLSRVHPQTRLMDLTPAQINTLARNALKLTRQSYQTGGITNDITRSQQLQREGKTFEESRFYIYRRSGEPCYRCDSEIVKGKFCGRTGYLCPDCQREIKR